MSREEELFDLVGDNPVLIKEVTELLFIEKQLDYLRTLPQISVHPKDASKQKPTTAAKQYISYLQQYNNIVKILIRATGSDEVDDESPLRQWTRAHFKEVGENR